LGKELGEEERWSKKDRKEQKGYENPLFQVTEGKTTIQCQKAEEEVWGASNRRI